MGSSATVIGGEYLVLGKIGEGSFGEVFRATHIATGVDYAIKREPINVAHPQLDHEAKIYAKLKGGDGIARVHWFGKEGMYNAMVIDLLGPNLKQVRRENEKFPLSFVIDLGVQILNQLEFIHKRGIVYRDIKPENFLLDADIILPDPPLGKAHTPPTYPDQTMSFFNDTRQRQHSIESNMSTSPGSPIINYDKPHLSIVDFGLATSYRDASGKHIPNRGSTPHKVGTARYASINIHCGRQHTRRDDIESAGYMLMEFLIGTLPWSGIMARNSKQGWSKMKEIKEEIELDELCEGLPKGFMTYIGYARSLKFDEEPDYDYLRNILRGSAGRGSEAQTVRCHREPVTHMSKSLEQCFDGIHIHRAHEPMRTKVSCKPEDPLKDWRNRPQYTPPQQDEYPDYNPNLMWTTTPPDPSGMAVMGPRDIHQEFKDKIEWGPGPESPQTLGSDASFGMFGDYQDGAAQGTARQRKPSWGDDDPSARWGREEDDNSNSSEDILPAFHIGSFQDELTPVPSHGKPSKGHPSVTTQFQVQSFGRYHPPQDARFYWDEPPFGLQAQNGARSGQNQPSASQPIPSGNRKYPGQTYINTFPPHPMVKDPASGSPKSLSSSLSSLSIRSGAEEEPGIEQSQASANRGHAPELHSPEKPAPRKYQGPHERVCGAGDRQENGWGPRPSGGNGSHSGSDFGHGYGYGTHQPHNNGNSARIGSENWQHPRDHGRHQQDRWRSDRRQQAGSVEPTTHFPDFYQQHQQQQPHQGSNGYGNQRNHHHHVRQNSAPGIRAHHHAASTSKQGFHHPIHSPHQGYGHGHGFGQASGQGLTQNQAHGYGQGQGQEQNYGQGAGHGDRRRRSRSRKCSNASLSSLSDHRNNNKVGNGNSNGNGNGNSNANVNSGRNKPK